MRIIKQGKPIKAKNTTPISIACQDCGLEAEIGWGEDVSKCPCCGSSNLVSTVPFVDLSRKKSPSERFPDEYYHFNSSGEGDAAILSEQSTAKMIDDTVEEYKKNNCGYAYSGAGDTFVAVLQTDEDDANNFLVMVSKDHYEYDFVNGE